MFQQMSPICYQTALYSVKRAPFCMKTVLLSIKRALNVKYLFVPLFFPSTRCHIFFSPLSKRSPFSNTYMYKSVSYFHAKSVVFYENSPILYQRAPIMFWFSTTEKFVFPSQDATHFFALIRCYSSCQHKIGVFPYKIRLF